MSSLLFCLLTTTAAADPGAVVVMPLKAKKIDSELLAALDELLAISVADLSGLKVITPRDIEAQLGRASMQQLMNCDASSCAAEIGGALGTRLLISGSARKLGKKMLLTLTLFDTRSNDNARGKTVFDGSPESFPDAVETAVKDVLGSGGTTLIGEVAPEAKGSDSDQVLIPAGAFIMGCNELKDTHCSDDEKPRRKIELDAFYIDRYEVTVEEYASCMDAGKCTKPEKGRSYNYGNPDRLKHPVNGVDWRQADAYCRWAGGSLPTEAQWEKAARGTDGRVYPWGDEPPTCERAVMNESAWGCGRNSTWPVGSKSAGASPYGVLDMVGNVSEWVNDYYGDYDENPKKNPRGVEGGTGQKKVLRGGNLAEGAVLLRTSRREASRTYSKGTNIGFRCVKPAG